MSQENQIMKSVKEGDIKSLGQLFERHSKSLYNYFLFQIKDHQKSEDLVQNVFYSILKYRHTYKDKYDFKVWMYTIARNESINYFKNRNERMQYLDPDQIANSENNPEKDFENKRAMNQLEKALVKLSSAERELITLRQVDQLSCEQIAEIVGCTAGAIRVRICRVLKALTKHYAKISGGSHDEV